MSPLQDPLGRSAVRSAEEDTPRTTTLAEDHQGRESADPEPSLNAAQEHAAEPSSEDGQEVLAVSEPATAPVAGALTAEGAVCFRCYAWCSFVFIVTQAG